ncbi:MAG: SDR family NAD(P)-dependent oxidoreductase [bacterium]
MNTNSKIAFVTGACSGIGQATASIFAEHGYDLFLIARRAERLVEIKQALEQKYNIKVHCITLDLRDRNALETAWKEVPNEWKKIDVLVNNAGLSLGLEPFFDGNVDDWENMIDTNIKSLLYVSKIVANEMIKNGSGHIINIGSIAGKESYPNGNVYCSTKAAVDSLTKSMRMDLVTKGIKVSAVHPGAVETEFSVVRFKGDQERADNVYKGFEPLVANDIADVIYFMASRPAHVNVQDVLVMPTAQAAATIINKVL